VFLLATISLQVTIGCRDSEEPRLAPHVLYDRNALAASVLSGDRIVALTSMGYPLSVERDTFRLMAEDVTQRGTCLGCDPGGMVLAGREDGQVVRLNPRTLEATLVGQIDGPVLWVGTWQDGRDGKMHVLAVSVHDLRLPSGEPAGLGRDFWPCYVADLTTGRTYDFGTRRATTFLIDSRGRLWAGFDHGEWGGWCGYVDLNTGLLTVLESPGAYVQHHISTLMLSNALCGVRPFTARLPCVRCARSLEAPSHSTSSEFVHGHERQC